MAKGQRQELSGLVLRLYKSWVTRPKIHKLFGLICFLMWPLSAVATVEVVPLSGHVIDQTDTLTTAQKTLLEDKLQQFEAAKGSQIVVLIVPSTSPEAIEQYALRVAEQWRLGRKRIDDGALLVIAKNDRALRIEVGYGLEGALNDATSKRIIAETITPYFKQGDFNGGITAGIDQILKVVSGEALPSPSKNVPNIEGASHYLPLLLIVTLVIGGFLRAFLGSFISALATGGIVALVAWLVVGGVSIALFAGMMSLLLTLFSGTGLGRSMLVGAALGGRSGGSSFSGGGGTFGGGGASGRW